LCGTREDWRISDLGSLELSKFGKRGVFDAEDSKGGTCSAKEKDSAASLSYQNHY
jgi:hypothetical protein